MALNKSGFDVEKFRKLVAHLHDANPNERDAFLRKALAFLEKYDLCFQEVIGDSGGQHGREEYDALRAQLENALNDLAKSKGEAAQRKAQAAQSQEIIDRLLKRIADLEAGVTQPPAAEDRTPEPSPSPPSPPWFDEIPPEPEPEAEPGDGEIIPVSLPKWKVGFWDVLLFAISVTVLLSWMIGRIITPADWANVFSLGVSPWRIVLATFGCAFFVGMVEAICGALYEYVLIGTRFGDWCMKTLGSPDAMFYCATNAFVAWTGALAGQAIVCGCLRNNSSAYWMLMSGLGILTAKWVLGDFKEHGVKWGATRLAVLVIGFLLSYSYTFDQILWVYDATRPAFAHAIGLYASLAMLCFLAVSETTIEFLLEGDRRWKWVCGVALLAVVITVWVFQHTPAQAVLGATQ
jgi:hypothetical protein